MRKGIILSGGTGTRLYPATKALSKQLMPVYDKPMIYYPISTLMLAGIRDILIITTPHEKVLFQNLLGDGADWGLEIQYAEQHSPGGLAQAYHVGADYVGQNPSALILGDNIFHGDALPDMLQRSNALTDGATVFGYHVADPKRYGILGFNREGAVTSIEEKPETPKSNYAVTGLYFYDGQAVDFARHLVPSARGELEITDLNRLYLNEGRLNVEIMGRGVAWLDTGTHSSLLEAALYTQVLEQRQGLKICCPEEIAWRLNYINDEDLRRLAEPLSKSGYGEYLFTILEGASRP